MWLVPFEHLTEDQQTAVQSSFGKNRIIIGGPGSGKTLVLLHRARLAVSQGSPLSSVRMFVYTKLLKQYLQEGLVELGLSEEVVSTFDSFCLGLFDEYVKGPRPKNEDNYIDFEKLREKILKKFESVNQKPLLDVVLVDEGQDLTETAIKILKVVSKHVTVAMDSRQQLYGVEMSPKLAASSLGIPNQSASLLTAYRCTQLIVDVAASFIVDEAEAAKFRASNLLPLEGVETPLALQFSSDEEEWDTLARALEERALLNQTSAILCPTNYWVNRVQKELQARGVPTSGDDAADFTDLQPEILTFHKAKGLTVDAVFLPGLLDSRFRGFGSHELISNILFVGLTRATRFLWLGLRTAGGWNHLETIKLLEQRSSIRLTSPEVPAQPSSVSTSSSPTDAPSMLDWL
jgi:superfamily I DNA/RNA helicase